MHFGYLAYLLVGGFVAWRWPKTIVLHAIAALWAALMVATPVDCPLTTAQEEFRRRAGQAPLHAGFVDVYINGRLYPADLHWRCSDRCRDSRRWLRGQVWRPGSIDNRSASRANGLAVAFQPRQAQRAARES